MKHLAAIAIVLLSGSAFAGETQRYLVATRKPARVGGLEAVRRAHLDPVSAHVTSFETFDGFGADLTPAEVERLRASADVRYVEPVLPRFAARVGSQSIPWGIEAVRAVQAQRVHPQGAINVAVLDTGVDSGHPELSAVYAGGFDYFTKLDQQSDVYGHGTHVAGTIAAADNDSGVLGVAPHVRLWGVKVLHDDGYGSTESLIAGIDWLVAKKAALGGNWIANLSLSSARPSEAEREAFRRAADRGILIFASSGNDSDELVVSPVAYPAAYAGVHAVGATTGTSAHALFSNQGAELDFVAPGTDVLSTAPRRNKFAAYVDDGDRRIVTEILKGSRIDTVSGDYIYCDLGRPEDFPASARGRIVLLRRGDIPFATKVRNAKAAGAIAAVIFNYDDGPHTWTLLADEEAKKEEWPVVVSLSRSDGERLAVRKEGRLELGVGPDDYATMSGTSMSTPHVAATAAFLWSLVPDAPPGTIITAMITTAKDLGAPGHDPVFGHGLVDLYAAAQLLAPYNYSTHSNGRTILRRGRGK
jgi:serine protease